MTKQTIDIVGAGVVGLSIALALQKLGHDVTVLDRKGIAQEASKGNAGAFAFSDIEPLASPGIIRKAPKWLFDPLGPLSIPPAYLPKITPWLFKFWKSSWHKKYHAALVAQADLMSHCKQALERQIEDVGGEHMMLRDGMLELYEGEQQFLKARSKWNLRKENGVKFEILNSPEQIAEIQPGLSKQFTHAGFVSEWINTCNPGTWAEHLAAIFILRGGDVINMDVQSIEQSDKAITLKTNYEDRVCDKIIIAAGAWSHHLSEMIGDKIPLETERGYNTVLPEGAFDIRTQLTFTDHGFVASKIDDGIKIGGAVELGGLKRKPDYRRADAMLEKAKAFLPDLDVSNGEQWMGFRPSMPDSLPVIGPSTRDERVVYAFGHGHLGLTQSAGTAELIANIISTGKPSMSVKPFSPDRF